MSENLGRAVLELATDSSRFDKGLSDAEGRTKRVTENLGNMGKKLTLGVTLPLAALGAKAFSAASDLEQSQGAVQSVFGDTARVIEDFGDTAAESFGLSRREVNEMGAVIGAQLKGMGFDVTEAANTVIDLEKRAADMAATFGGPTKDAVGAIASLMRGERDPIERYGVSIKAVDVNARIMAMGLDTSTTAAQKKAEAIAGLDLLMEQTADTEGAFARESDTAAGATARARAQFEDAAAVLGESLLPIGAQVIDMLADVAGWFSDLSPATRTWIIRLAGLAAIAGPVFVGVSKMVTVFNALAGAYRAIAAALVAVKVAGVGAATASGVGAAGAAAGGATSKLGTFATALLGAKAATIGLLGALGAVATGVIVGGLKLDELARKHNLYVREVEPGISATDAYAKELLGSGAAAARTAEEQDRLSNRLNFQRGAHARAKRAAEILGHEFGKEKEEAEELRIVLLDLTDVIDQVTGRHLNAERAALGWEESISSLSGTLQTNGATLDIHTEKGRANRQAIVDATEAALRHVDALVEEGASVSDVLPILEGHRDSIEQVMLGYGMSQEEVDAFLDSLGLIPSRIVSEIEATTTVKVRAPVLQWMDVGGGRIVPRMTDIKQFWLAEGGIALGDVMARIGEAGRPEAVIPLDDRGAGFMAETMQKALGQLGDRLGDRRPILVEVKLSERKIAEALYDYETGL